MKKCIAGIVIGVLFSGAIETTAFAQNADVMFSDLPKEVQKDLRSKKDHIKRIEEFSYHGKTFYEVRLDPTEPKEFIYVDQHGNRVDDKAMRDERSAERRDERYRSATVPSEQFNRPLAARQKIDFNSAPEAVKRTVRDLADGNRIEDAERGTLDGRRVYEFAYKKNSIRNEVRIGEDGSVMQHIAGTNIRLPGKVSINEVPDPVRRSIRREVGSGEVNDIDRKMEHGTTVYEVGFKRQGGREQHELRIAEDGTVLGEAAGANR